MRPMRDCTAPVNAPFTNPNNSASSSGSGIAAQLITTNGFSRRAQLVDRLGDQVFAGPAFAGNHDGGVALGDQASYTADALH